MTAKTHRPLVAVVLFFMGGIAAACVVSISFVYLVPAAAALLFLSLLFINKKVFSTFLLLTAFSVLAVLAAENSRTLPKDHIYKAARYYKNEPVLLKGIIVSDIQKRKFFKREKLVFTLEVKQFKAGTGKKWQKRQGLVLVNSFKALPLSYGDEIIVEGKLYRPFNFSTEKENKFSYRDYLDRKGIKFLLSVKKDGSIEVLRSGQGNFLQAASFRLKEKLSLLFKEHLSPNESAIMTAIILGDRYEIPRHVMDLFTLTGTVHILAISGQNIGIVAFLVYLLLMVVPMSRRMRFVFTIIFLIFYAFLTGAQPSVVRATIMAVVLLAGFLVEREADVINSLALAALIILIINPLNLFDVGFELSFASVLAIVWLYPRIFSQFSRFPIDVRRQPLLFILQSMTVSLAAWLGVSGLIAYYFHIVTPVSVLANLPAVPLISALIALGLGLLLVGSVCPSLIFAFAACIKVVLNTMVACVYLFSQLPLAYIFVPNVSLWYVVVYYCLVVAVFYFIKACAIDKVNQL